MPSSEKRGTGPLAVIYLTAYNVAQTLGWSALMLSISSNLLTRGYQTLYEENEMLLKAFQTAAILEVVHCAIGIVRSNVLLTAVQVASRVFLVWGIVHTVPQTQTNFGVLMLLLAWTVTEIIRYSFYTFQLVGHVPYVIKWMRYTFFIVLYPLGVTGELLCIYSALPIVKSSGIYSISLPNRANMSFNYFYFLIAIMLSYIPIFPQLYFHMIHQRKKMLGEPEEKKRQ
ncbi:very-long-chain (3R)-3-hydroxyacyl-CoA dehydratase 2-like [Liolophura sinensis]|uniref:very-long-chain (3R)-3-hydroxyacyl-CoA dehydratase 2-like n=1 Tax=Liolophura sinensis TaxID=3198878 RepID=UPI003158CD0A